MVTSKRKIVREQDNTGYYEDVPVSRSVVENTDVAFNDDLIMMRSYVEKNADVEKAPADPVFRPAPGTAEPEEVAAPVRRTVRTSDVMPVITKRPAEEKEKEVKVSVKSEKALSPTMKKALIAYLAVVVILTIAVIATGIAINSVTAEIDDYEGRVASLNQTIALQEADLLNLTDPEWIGSRAEEIGLVDANSVVTAQAVKIRSTQEEAPMNWFDIFCDWIGGLFGG